MSGEASPRAPGQVKEVTSPANPIIKSVRGLSRKKNRDQQGLFIAEGIKLIMEARDLGWEIRTLIVARNAVGNELIDPLAAHTVARGGLVLQVSKKVLEAVSRRDNPQNAIAVIAQQHHGLPTVKPESDDLWIALDRVRDPGNLGTIIRTADAVGAKGVILIGECTDPFAIETVRATMGSIFAMPVVKASEREFIAWIKNWPGLSAGSHLRGAVDYRYPDYQQGPVLLVMGNEQQGMGDELAGACKTLVRIPQAGRADSLNLAVASALMMYEARRRHFPMGDKE